MRSSKHNREIKGVDLGNKEKPEEGTLMYLILAS